jgi:8-oxo-dGTP pyrophosphatase MutT (NUDIX family)
VDYWHDRAPPSHQPQAIRERDGLQQRRRAAAAPPARFRALDDPHGRLKKGETLTQCAVRECREETGLDVEVISLAGLFSDPDHVIAYADGEVRQPVNACFAARVIGGRLTTTDEASDVAWVPLSLLDDYDIRPSIRRRIAHGLEAVTIPFVD